MTLRSSGISGIVDQIPMPNTPPGSPAREVAGVDLALTTGGVECKVRQGTSLGMDAKLAGTVTGRPGIYLDDIGTRIDYVFVVQTGI